jgi:uncharacterized protein YjbI with pentapeptide repeats
MDLSLGNILSQAREKYGFSPTAFAGRLGNYDKNMPPAPAPEQQRAPTRNAEEQTLFDYKAEALSLAKSAAEARSKETGRESKPTMTDYFIAAAQLGESKKEEMAAKGVRWTPAVIADLGAQKIDGFQINKSDMKPRAEVLQMATLRAREAARASGQNVQLADVLKQVQTIQASGERIDGSPDAMARVQEGITALEDTMDLDGNATMAFYEMIDRHANFNDTVFSNVSFHPAGTLMRDGESGIALTEGASFVHCTFDGMGADDRITFEGKKFEDVTFTNIKGGSITIPDGTQVNGMDIRGAHAELHIGRASVSNLDASDARIVTFTTAKGAEISHSKFNGTTIGMGSELSGSKWSNVEFNGANLGGVDMRDTTLANVRFRGDCDLNGLDLRGASMDNLRINGELIRDAGQINAMKLGITMDETTAFRVDPELLREQEIAAKTRAVADIGKVLVGQMGSIGTPTAPAAQPPAQTSVEVAAAAPAKTAITFSGNVNLNDVALTTAVASLERTVPLNEQASGTNMQRDTTA